MELSSSVDTDLARSRLELAVRESAPEFGRFFLARFLDLAISYDDSARTCTVRLPAAEFLFNPQGSMHGGIVATAMDISMGHLCHRYLSTAMTLEMHTRYFKPIRDTAWCRGQLLAVRGRTVLLESRMYDADDDLAAFATGTWRLLDELRNQVSAPGDPSSAGG